MIRSQVLEQLASFIAAVQRSHPVRVAIDGIDAAGKTMLANELVQPIEQLGRQVIRASIDGFHRPRKERYQRGADSPEGYYLDSFDYTALREMLLVPLGPNGNHRYCRAAFDFRKDTAVEPQWHTASDNAILVFEGVFLLRPELRDCWDCTVFVQVDFETALQRAKRRDLSLFGTADDVELRYRKRYIPGQQVYFRTAHPQEIADIIVENNDVENPQLVYCA